MADAYLYDAKGRDRQVDLAGKPLSSLAAGQLLWIDLERADAAGLGNALQYLGIDRSDCSAQPAGDAAAYVVRFPTHFEFSVILAPAHGEKQDRHLYFLIAEHWLITIRDGEVPFLVDFRDKDRGETEIGALSPAVLAASLLDWHLDAYFGAISRIEAAIDALDEGTLAARTDMSALNRLSAMRRRLTHLRRQLSSQRGVFYGLTRPDFSPVASAEATEHFRTVERRFDRAIDQLEVARVAVAGSFDLFATRTAQETNELVKRLTFVTVLLGFAGAIAGIFGMNFKTGFSDSGEHGFHVVVGALCIGAIVFTLLARTRKWI